MLAYVSPWTLLGLIALGAGFSIWVSRRYQEFALFRPGESVLSGAVTFAIGVSAAILLFPREAAFVGWIVLAVGDGVATLAGRRWPLRPLAGGRSLGGSLAFLLSAFAAVLAADCWWRGEFRAALVVSSLVVSLAGTTTELLCRRLDDNLLIPSVAALAFVLIQ